MTYPLPESTLIAQGAEARLHKGVYLGKTVLIKERFEKTYRHPTLDTRLTKERIKAETRALVKAKAAGKFMFQLIVSFFDTLYNFKKTYIKSLIGVATPTIYLVDYNRRSIFMEYIENATMLKTFIDEHISKKNDVSSLLENIATALGKVVAQLHSVCIVHGDLTTSNILLKDPENLITSKPSSDGKLDLIFHKYSSSIKKLMSTINSFRSIYCYRFWLSQN